MADIDKHREAVLATIHEYYADGSSYGLLSQRLHGLQAARQAELAGAPDAVVCVQVWLARASGR